MNDSKKEGVPTLLIKELVLNPEQYIIDILFESYKNIALPFGGFDVWVRRPSDGKAIDLSHLLGKEITEDDLIVDYNFGISQEQSLAPRVILDYLTAKHGSSLKALKVLNEMLNQKPN